MRTRSKRLQVEEHARSADVASRRLRIAALAAILGTVLAGCAPSAPPIRYYVRYGLPYEPSLRLDAYLPLAPGKHPAVVLIHPGGFVGGHRAEMGPIARTLADRGFTAVCIDYSTPARYPEALSEVEDAVAYVHSHFRVGDVGLLGASAGGTLALSSVAGVRAVAAWSAIIDLSHAGFLQHPVSIYLAGAPARAASPIDLLKRGYPPTLLVTSRRDLVPVRSAAAVIARLRALGTPGRLLVVPTGHALQYTARALRPTIRFFRQFLEP